MQVNQEAVDLCTTIPGIDAIAAANLIAEIGVNMISFPSCTSGQLGRACPGNNESAANDSAENPEMEMHGYGATYAKWHGEPRTVENLFVRAVSPSGRAQGQRNAPSSPWDTPF
jgi:hypothetical protein